MPTRIAVFAVLLASCQGGFSIPVESAPLLSEVKSNSSKEVSEADLPSDLDCVAQAAYRYRPDGKPGREITVTFKFKSKTHFVFVSAYLNT